MTREIEAALLRPAARDVSLLGPAVAGQLSRLAEMLAGAAAEGRRIGLVTGVHIAWAARPAAETDGPVGTAVLARALTLLGADPVVLTDAWCAPVVDACLDTLGCHPVMVVPPGPEDDVRRLVAELDLAALVAVERLGPNAFGRVLTMGAVDITETTVPLHAAFDLPHLPTGAIGDGGNEIGMGNLPAELIAAAIVHGPDIACRVPVDALVVAGTSNWGCYGLIASLARSRPELAVLLDPSTDRELLAAAVDAGGIDGVTGEAGLTVDGVPAEDYADLLRTLARLARA